MSEKERIAELVKKFQEKVQRQQSTKKAAEKERKD